jgi:hypothetical protein
MSPMIKLTQKDTDFIWTTECEDAFIKLKSYLVDENKVLTLPDFSKPFQIETDASKRGVGGVLSQKVGKHFQPVAYFSKHLSRTESNYSTSEREMLGIVLSFEHFKEYVRERHKYNHRSRTAQVFVNGRRSIVKACKIAKEA